MAAESTIQRETLFGHPVGLFTLFFSEMWERFSYYGMRALLVFYMTKAFLQYSDDRAYGVYGAYTALVYAVGFIGGMFADRLLGQRRAAVLGGLLMAAGHLTMMWQWEPAFYVALGLIITGNGFFKPNVSTIVGTLYPPGSPRRDGGFTIYYMGVNLVNARATRLRICGRANRLALRVWVGDGRHARRARGICCAELVDAAAHSVDGDIDHRFDALSAGQRVCITRKCFCGTGADDCGGGGICRTRSGWFAGKRRSATQSGVAGS